MNLRGQWAAAMSLVALMISGCGSAARMPPGVVATVTGTPGITRASFEHWLAVAETENASSGGRQPAVPPARLREEVMSFLISSDWTLAEATVEGVTVTEQEARGRLDAQERRQFPRPGQLQGFLRQSGMTVSDLLFRIRMQSLLAKLEARATGGKARVTAQQIADYYRNDQPRFSHPERRDVQLVLTRTRSQALAARRALESGRSFAQVVARYSIDPASRNRGGRLVGLVRGQEVQALDVAIFAAPLGALEGPVQTPFGYYLLRVTNVTPPTRQPLAQAAPTIRSVLANQAESQTVASFLGKLRTRWTAHTTCRQGFVIDLCKNAGRVTTTAAS